MISFVNDIQNLQKLSCVYMENAFTKFRNTNNKVDIE